MSDTQTVPTADLEELLDAEIPCGGVIEGKTPPCDRPAVLVSRAHGCAPEGRFKCLACWQAWCMEAVRRSQSRGYNICPLCLGEFFNVTTFSDYRPF